MYHVKQSEKCAWKNKPIEITTKCFIEITHSRACITCATTLHSRLEYCMLLNGGSANVRVRAVCTLGGNKTIESEWVWAFSRSLSRLPHPPKKRSEMLERNIRQNQNAIKIINASKLNGEPIYLTIRFHAWPGSSKVQTVRNLPSSFFLQWRSSRKLMMRHDRLISLTYFPLMHLEARTHLQLAKNEDERKRKRIIENWNKNENLDKEIYFIQSHSFRFVWNIFCFLRLFIISDWARCVCVDFGFGADANNMPPRPVCVPCVCLFCFRILLFYYNKFWFSTFFH